MSKNKSQTFYRKINRICNFNYFGWLNWFATKMFIWMIRMVARIHRRHRHCIRIYDYVSKINHQTDPSNTTNSNFVHFSLRSCHTHTDRSVALRWTCLAEFLSFGIMPSANQPTHSHTRNAFHRSTTGQNHCASPLQRFFSFLIGYADTLYANTDTYKARRQPVSQSVTIVCSYLNRFYIFRRGKCSSFSHSYSFTHSLAHHKSFTFPFCVINDWIISYLFGVWHTKDKWLSIIWSDSLVRRKCVPELSWSAWCV